MTKPCRRRPDHPPQVCMLSVVPRVNVAAPRAWYERYAHRVGGGRRPRAEAEREAYARTVGEDGFALLDLLDRPEAPEELRRLPTVGVLRRGWGRQFVRADGADGGGADGRLPPARPAPAVLDHVRQRHPLRPARP